jgi:pilus assembly protein Flp/PilA
MLETYLRILNTRREEGQGLVEYALILVLIAVAVMAAVGILGGQINTVFGQITTGLT